MYGFISFKWLVLEQISKKSFFLYFFDTKSGKYAAVRGLRNQNSCISIAKCNNSTSSCLCNVHQFILDEIHGGLSI